MSKKDLGQFYTTNSDYILQDLLSFMPSDNVLEPFAGNMDLAKYFSNIETFDIEPKSEKTIKRDTLINPPDYNNKWVITNPPFLARNKSEDKTIFDLYGVNDLYKAFLLSILDSNGGVIIIPTNFFCDEDDRMRTQFLSKFEIQKIFIFEERVFNDTDISVCSFFFKRKENIEQDINFIFMPLRNGLSLKLNIENGYKIDPFSSLGKNEYVYRLIDIADKNKTKIFLQAVDSGTESGRIKLVFKEEYFVGIKTDRAFATICIKGNKLSEEEQKIIIKNVNNIFEIKREEYNSLFLTNFRNSTKNYSRKRVSFDLIYKIINHEYKKML